MPLISTVDWLTFLEYAEWQKKGPDQYQSHNNNYSDHNSSNSSCLETCDKICVWLHYQCRKCHIKLYTCGNTSWCWQCSCCYKGWYCWQNKYSRSRREACKVNTMHIHNAYTQCIYTVIINFNSPGVNINTSLHSPLPELSSPLTLKEYTTPVCSVSTMYCDVVFMFVMIPVLELVTSTWYTTTHWLSIDQVRLTDDPTSDVVRLSVTLTFLGGGGEPKDKSVMHQLPIIHAELASSSSGSLRHGWNFLTFFPLEGLELRLMHSYLRHPVYIHPAISIFVWLRTECIEWNPGLHVTGMWESDVSMHKYDKWLNDSACMSALMWVYTRMN